MCPLRYYPMPRRSTEPTYLRFELVRYARAHGVKPAARQFGTTVKTVRKWLRRWEPGSLRGLADHSRAPIHPRQGITERQRRQAVRLKLRLPSWGAARMKRDFSLALSEKALRRIWREEGLLKRKRRKHRTKQCLREVKRAWRLFEQRCVDTKDLCDIPELWAQAKALGLPRYQYTAREVTSGWRYLSFAQECTLAYSKLFAEVVLEHLQSCGVKSRDSRLQTDNGCESVGHWQSRSDSQFTAAVEVVKGLRHTRCPPRAHAWQSDVETAHRLVEDEFYEVERFTSRADFIAKTGAYNLWFNVGRRNRGEEHKTPWELIHEREPKVDPAVCALPPIYLDELFMRKLDSKLMWGYDVIPTLDQFTDVLAKVYDGGFQFRDGNQFHIVAGALCFRFFDEADAGHDYPAHLWADFAFRGPEPADEGVVLRRRDGGRRLRECWVSPEPNRSCSLFNAASTALRTAGTVPTVDWVRHTLSNM
ncbi:MAG: helix-turn-helix domain-containing protein [Acidobacteria bacterium]|nr:helix-turn-helix domain-containing protein [Acidobacteriota bacterium]